MTGVERALIEAALKWRDPDHILSALGEDEAAAGLVAAVDALLAERAEMKATDEWRELHGFANTATETITHTGRERLYRAADGTEQWRPE